MRTLLGLVVAAAPALALSACSDAPPATGAPAAHPEYWDPPAPTVRGSAPTAAGPASPRAAVPAGARKEDPPPSPAVADKRTPSGHFLISKERLADLRARVASGGGPEWALLKENADEAVRTLDRSRSSPENVATAYLVTKDRRFAEAAFKWFKTITAKENVRDDSYLGYGDLMRNAAIVLNYCADALSAEQQKEILDYLERWTDELWFHNKGTGWGTKDAANNYYCGFVEGSAYAAYALQAAKRPIAPKFVELTRQKIEENGTLAYLSKEAKGGDWHEGANYGERAKQRLFSAFAAIASMGGPNYFAKSSFPNESILYAIYQVQPGRAFLAPTGDLSRESVMDVTPFDRDYMQIATYWTDDAALRGLGAWYLKEVAPAYVGRGINLRYLLYRDVLFPPAGAATPPTKLPLGYRSVGTDWLNARSAWDDAATSLTVEANPHVTQSHAHYDTGAFFLWRGDWQAADATTYTKPGLNWDSCSHNMICVPGHQRESGKSRGLVHYRDDAGVFYAEIDASNLFKKRRGNDDVYPTMVEEWTRELVYVRPDTLVVYDRVVPKPEAKDWSWRVHFPKKPTSSGQSRWSATNGSGAMTVAVLDGGQAKVAQDSDLTEGASTAWRLELAANPSGRTLAVVKAGAGQPPAIATESITAPGIQGVAWETHVAVFSAQPLGRPASLPFSYKLKDGKSKQHLLFNMSGSCDVTVTRAGGEVTVRVSPGAKYRANEQGMVRFEG